MVQFVGYNYKAQHWHNKAVTPNENHLYNWKHHIRTKCIHSEHAKKVNETYLLLHLYLGHLAECLVFVQAFCKVSQCGPQYSMKARQPFLSD